MAETIITVEKTNWERCFICQQVTKEKLSQPSRECDFTAYDTFARNVPLFHKINALPVLLSPTRLDEGDGIKSTLTRHRAQYHTSCKLMFNNTKLERALFLLEGIEVISLSVVQSSETGSMVFKFLCNNITSTKLCKEFLVA